MVASVQVRLSLSRVHCKQYTSFSHLLTGTMVASLQVSLSSSRVHCKQYTKFRHILTGRVVVLYYHTTLQQYLNISHVTCWSINQ